MWNDRAYPFVRNKPPPKSSQKPICRRLQTRTTSEASHLTAKSGRWRGCPGCAQAVVMTETMTVTELLEGHVALDVRCLDRVYLNGSVPKLHLAGQVVGFMTRHLGLPIPSPAIMEKIGTRFRRAVAMFALDITFRWSSSTRTTAGSTGCGPTWRRMRGRAARGWPRSGSLRSTRTCSR